MKNLNNSERKYEKEYPCNVQEFQRHSADENPVGFEGRLNPAQLKKELEDKNVECSLVVGWSVYEPDEVTELTPSQAIDFHDCLEELSEVDIRFNVNGHSIENGSIRLSYNIYEHNIMVTRVWLNGKESKELLDTIQQWLDNNQE